MIRDLTERVIVASKGRFDRAISSKQRTPARAPSEVSHVPRRVHGGDHRPLGDRARAGEPGRAPGAVPRRAARAPDPPLHLPGRPRRSTRSWVRGPPRSRPCATDRHYVGYDTDPEYVAAAEARISAARDRQRRRGRSGRRDDPPRACCRRFPRPPILGGLPGPCRPRGPCGAGSGREALEVCGFTDIEASVALPGGVDVNFVGPRRRRTHLVLRRVGRLHVEPAWPEAHRHPLEGDRQGRRAAPDSSRPSRSCC